MGSLEESKRVIAVFVLLTVFDDFFVLGEGHPLPILRVIAFLLDHH